MTEQELKNVQKAIRSFNLYYSNSLKKGIEDSTSGIIDELIDVDRMSKKGYAKYSMKMLKGMSRQEIEEYMGDLTSAKHLLVAVTELPDFVEYAAGIALKGDREGLWYLYDKMRENAPKITKVYVNWGLSVFRTALLFAVVCGVSACILNRKQKKRNSIGLLIMLSGCVLLHALWYTMSGAGMMEYGNVCVIQMLWYCAIVRLIKSGRYRAE
jgi:hypothetical protein